METKSQTESSLGVRRYPGSHPYQDNEVHKLLFSGRSREIESLLHLVLTERLVVVFAKSGMGKTSLLNAGLMQRLRDEDHVPIRITFTEKGTDPIMAVYTAMEDFGKTCKEKFGYEYTPGPKGLLWEFFKLAEVWSHEDALLTPVLVFDQFEELFTLHNSSQRQEFIAQLADIVRGRVPQALLTAQVLAERSSYSAAPPKVRIVLSIREDYLGLLEEFSREIPEILDKRFRLLPLKRKEAEEAIVKPATIENEKIQSAVIDYEPQTVKEMLDFLCRRLSREEKARRGLFVWILQRVLKALRLHREEDWGKPTDEVEPFQLQLLCQYIETEVVGGRKTDQERAKVTIAPADLGGREGMKRILKNFYREQVKSLPSVWTRRKVRELCESHLIIAPGLRLSHAEEYIQRKTRLKHDVLQSLVDLRLLRSESRGDRIYYELSHDTLVEPIRTVRRERKRRRNWIIAIVLMLILIPPGVNFLRDYRIELREARLIESHKDSLHAARQRKDKERVRAESQWLLSTLMVHGDYDSAFAIYKEALDDNIDPDNLWRGAGTQFRGVGRDDLARQAEKVEIVKGEQETATYASADSIPREERARAVGVQGAQYYSNLACTYVKWDQYDKAIELYKKGLERKFDPVELSDPIIKALLEKGRRDQVALIEEATGVDTSESKRFRANLAWRFYEKGIHLERDENYTEAVTYLQKATQLEKNYYSAYRALAFDFYNIGQFDDAIDNCQIYIKRAPSDYSVLNLMGVIYHDHRFDYSSAYDVLKQAVQIAPEDSSIKANFAEACLCAGHFAESCESATQVLRIPDIPAYFRLALKFVIASSKFCLGERQEGNAWLKGTVNDCSSLPNGYKSGWLFLGTKKYLREEAKLQQPDRERLLAVLVILEIPEINPEQDLRSLKGKYPDLF